MKSVCFEALENVIVKVTTAVIGVTSVRVAGHDWIRTPPLQAAANPHLGCSKAVMCVWLHEGLLSLDEPRGPVVGRFFKSFYRRV